MLFRRRTIWWPTWPVWVCLIALAALSLLLWWYHGEVFLSRIDRQPAEVLVVEGWIAADAIRAAKAEFDQGSYRYVVATGSQSGNPWDSRRWSYAAEAEEQLLRMGVPRDRVILATPVETGTHRTFASAVAVWQALVDRGIRPRALNIFTKGPHARRSQLVFAKVFKPSTKVGVVSWTPPSYASEPWWKSSERAGDMLKETVGYTYELLLNSGRTSNSPDYGRR